jgi:hypothetical protein
MIEGHWKSKHKLSPDTKYGFIYQITFLLTGQKYIGKKSYWSWNRTGTKKVKESAWRSYTSSSTDLNALIKEYGKEWFYFEVITECCTKSCWSYMESNLMHKMDVLTLKDPVWNERVFLNKAINKVQWIPKHCDAVKNSIKVYNAQA